MNSFVTFPLAVNSLFRSSSWILHATIYMFYDRTSTLCLRPQKTSIAVSARQLTRAGLGAQDVFSEFVIFCPSYLPPSPFFFCFKAQITRAGSAYSFCFFPLIYSAHILNRLRTFK